MKLILVIIFAGFFIFGNFEVYAKSGASTQKPKSNYKTQHDFDDTLVSGKYQTPMGSVVKVDDDKTLDDLIGVRKNFRDRIEESQDRN